VHLRQLALFAAALLSVTGVAQGQVSTANAIVLPGSARLSPEHIRIGLDTFAVVAEREGQAQVVAILMLRTDSMLVEGRRLLLRTEVMEGGGGMVIHTDTFSLGLTDLIPVRQRSWDGQTRQSLDFSRSDVHGKRTRAGLDSIVTFATPEPAFYANSIDLVLAALPLTKGFSARLPLADASGVKTAQVVVEDREEVSAADGTTCEAWRIRIRGSGNQGTYWLGVADGRILIFDGGEGMLKIVRVRGCLAPGARA
jgi:hypothetical protein